AKARALVDEAPRIARRANATAGAAPPVAGGYALAAISARYALERGAWAEAAQLQPLANAAPYVEAISWFARGLGGARARQWSGEDGARRAATPCRCARQGGRAVLGRAGENPEARRHGVGRAG